MTASAALRTLADDLLQRKLAHAEQAAEAVKEAIRPNEPPRHAADLDRRVFRNYLSKDWLHEVVTRKANIELMLRNNVIHGDPSPFNVLYVDGNVKLIDFPQAIDARTNPSAYALLSRDVGNVCDHFAKYAIRADAGRIAGRLWSRFLRAEL